MSDDFLDTNIFVYQFDIADERRRSIADRIVTEALLTGSAAISFQVVQETLATLTRKLARPVALPDAAGIFDRFLVPL